MGKKSLAGLIVINLAIMLALSVLSFSPTPEPAYGQGFGGAGSYLMIAAKRSRNTHDTIYITDLSRGVILAVEPNVGRKELRSTGFRPIGEDLTEDRRDR